MTDISLLGSCMLSRGRQRDDDLAGRVQAIDGSGRVLPHPLHMIGGEALAVVFGVRGHRHDANVDSVST